MNRQQRLNKKGKRRMAARYRRRIASGQNAKSYKLLASGLSAQANASRNSLTELAKYIDVVGGVLDCLIEHLGLGDLIKDMIEKKQAESQAKAAEAAADANHEKLTDGIDRSVGEKLNTNQPQQLELPFTSDATTG